MLTVRETKREDLKELSLLFKELMGMECDEEKMNQTFRHIQNDESYILLVAEEESKIVGTLMGIICYDLVGACEPFLVIENVVVKEDQRGKGVGKALLREIEKRAKVEKVNYSMLLSGVNREAAHHFYERNGYKGDVAKGFKKYL
jgi:phosphoglycolate phosphatase